MTTTRKRVPRAEREQQMLAHAEAVFAEAGYQQASMDEIAARVGVTKPMLYEYFGSKDGLLRACLERARAQLLDVTVAAAAQGGSPRDLLTRAVRAFFEFVDAHDAAWRVLQSESLLTAGPGVAQIEGIRRQQSEVTAALLRGLPGGNRLGRVELAVRAEVVTGTCERVAVWRAQQRRRPSAARTTELVLDALGPGLLGEPVEPGLSRAR